MPEPAASTLVCSNCRYDLAGLSDSAACPECAQPIATTLAHRARMPAPHVLRSASGGCYTAATGLLIPLAGFAAAILAESEVLFAITPLLAVALWVAGGFAISGLAPPRPLWMIADNAKVLIRVVLLILATATAATVTLWFCAFLGLGDPLALIMLSILFVFAAGTASWFLMFHRLSVFARTMLRNRAIPRACLLAAGSYFAPALAFPFIINRMLPASLLFLLAPFIIGASALISAGLSIRRFADSQHVP